MKKIAALLMILFFYTAMQAQDTVHVIKRERVGDKYCWPEIQVNKSHFIDTIPQSFIAEENNLELRINDDCPVKKKADVFIVSFEIAVESSAGTKFSAAQSSFFTGKQKKLMRTLKPGDFFTVRNIVIHAPDGFKKIDNFKVTLN